MSTEILSSTCACGSIGRSDLRRCDEHHRYWRGDHELASVTKVLKSTWPIKPDFSNAPAGVIEHARERGVRIDRYFSEYLTERRTRIPVGEWEEVDDLTKTLIKWWKTTIFALGRPQAQVILADDEIAGTCDVLCDGIIADLKATHDIEVTYPIQLGAYAELYEATFGVPAVGIGLIHIHKRFKDGPRWLPQDIEQCREDWRALRNLWRVVQRRVA